MQKKDLTPEAREYFDSLPELLREQLVESGVVMTPREELEDYCKNVLKADMERD